MEPSSSPLLGQPGAVCHHFLPFFLDSPAQGRPFIMINELSNAFVLYLAPALSLTGFVLAVLSFLSPTVILHGQVSLLVVTPVFNKSGPSVFLGALGTSIS